MLLRAVPSSVRGQALPFNRWSPRYSRRPLCRHRCPRNVSAKTAVEPAFVETDVVNSDSKIEDRHLYEYEPLTTTQIKKLVTVFCEETNIAHLDLEFGSFNLRIERTAGKTPSHGSASPQAVGKNASSHVAESPSTPAPSVGDSLSEESNTASIDESLMLIDSPKVGIFRNGVFNKNGKKIGKGPNPGDQVRAGQALCAIEQLGTYAHITAPQQGEVLAFPFIDGEFVAYKDAVVEFAPYFGGHIIGDKKYV